MAAILSAAMMVRHLGHEDAANAIDKAKGVGLGVQVGIFTRKGCERIITYAFEQTRKRNKKKRLTSITKSNALGFGMITWDKAFERVAERYPDIETNSLLIDSACMDFIRKPEEFDVVVASNLFGDILTDIGAIISGSMGTADDGLRRIG